MKKYVQKNVEKRLPHQRGFTLYFLYQKFLQLDWKFLKKMEKERQM